MSEHIEIEYRGVRLVYYANSDKWGPCEHNSPISMGTMAEVQASIKRMECQIQVLAGVKVWDLSHDNPKYWSQKDAVFRNDPQAGTQTGTDYVITRNFRDNPDSLYNLTRGDTAMTTPEVDAAMEAAKAAYADAVAANDRWKEAKRAIPRMTKDELLKLTARNV